MNLEITIKVPLGSPEVSISRELTGLDTTTESVPTPAAVVGDGASAPPVEQLTGVVEPEPTTEVPPPHPSTLGVETSSAVEAGPPSLALVQESSGGGSFHDDPTPPALDELLGSASLDTSDLEPPTVDELEAFIASAETAAAPTRRSTKTTTAAKKRATKAKS